MTTTRAHKHEKAVKAKKFLFNYYEISFCGSPSGQKTALIKKLIEELSSDYDIGYVRTIPVKEGDSQSIFIGREGYYGNTTTANTDFILSRNLLFNSEVVFIDDTLESGSSCEIAYIGENDNDFYEQLKDNGFKKTAALILHEKSTVVPENIPSFTHTETAKIADFISGIIAKDVKAVPLYGLVLTGGKSSRMKKDKAALNYHGVPQTEHSFRLLEKYCDKVFLSARPEQAEDNDKKEFPQIHDLHHDIGPMGGILSAMEKYPDTAWLVMACDLPFTDTETISYLIENRNPLKAATAFISSSDGFPEPLCAIYEPKSKFRLYQFLGLGYSCPRKVLINSEVKLLVQLKENSLDNVNHPEEFEAAVKRLQG